MKKEGFIKHYAGRYHLKADFCDEGIPITIRDGVLTEETKDHLMVYELTCELDG